MFPFIRFTNWKQGVWCRIWIFLLGRVSIHTLHELEASLQVNCFNLKGPLVSIHTLHELEARGRIGLSRGIITVFPFIRFTNWKQDGDYLEFNYTPDFSFWFPFIRFTNWKQATLCHAQKAGDSSFHSYASRIGSKLLFYWRLINVPENVSIHTLHELEASYMRFHTL